MKNESDPYPFGLELAKNMKKWISLPINQVSIVSPTDDFVLVEVRVIMTREQIRDLFSDPV